MVLVEVDIQLELMNRQILQKDLKDTKNKNRIEIILHMLNEVNINLKSMFLLYDLLDLM